MNKFIAGLYYLKCQSQATDPWFCISLLSTYSTGKIKINYALMILTPLNCYPLIEATSPDIIHVLWNPDAELSDTTLPWISQGQGWGQQLLELRMLNSVPAGSLSSIPVALVCA